jgi:GT2 family glycosyltransferase
MISVIICSIDPAKFARIGQHYQQLFGSEPYELIGIHDARSLSEGYNRGITRARGEIVIFCHDDLEFLSPQDWLARLKSHLARFDLLGFAGTTRLAYPMWNHSGPPYIFGQVAHVAGTTDWPQPYRLELYGAPAAAIYGIQAMDGLFLAMRREVLNRVAFDEKTFNGFHCYDLDFTFSAYLAGFKLAVACDMPLLHDSSGDFNSDAWRQSAMQFMHKHSRRLPPVSRRRFIVAQVSAETKEELLQIMSPPYLRPPS